MPIRVIITNGAEADCQQAIKRIEGLDAGYLLADRGYDSDERINQALAPGMTPVIPPRKHRNTPRQYEKYLYKIRCLVENALLHLKRWRGSATRYAKNAASFLAAVQVRCLALWCPVS